MKKIKRSPAISYPRIEVMMTESLITMPTLREEINSKEINNKQIISILKEFEEEKRVHVSFFFTQILNDRIPLHQITSFVCQQDKLVSIFFLLSIKNLKRFLPKFVVLKILSFSLHSFLDKIKIAFQTEEKLKSVYETF